MPPAMEGWRVLTRPSNISGNRVTSETSRKRAIPASLRTRKVPPVERISMSSAARARANSAIPDLLVTLNRARCMRGMNHYCALLASRLGNLRQEEARTLHKNLKVPLFQILAVDQIAAHRDCAGARFQELR